MQELDKTQKDINDDDKLLNFLQSCFLFISYIFKFKIIDNNMKFLFKVARMNHDIVPSKTIMRL